MYLKEFMLIRQMNQKNVTCVIIGISKIGIKYEPYLCNGFHGLMQKGYKF